MKKIDISNMSYKELEEHYNKLLYKFANWPIEGIEYDDILQELKIVLWKAQRKFNSKAGTKFITYLYNAFKNTMYWQHERKAIKQTSYLDDPEAQSLATEDDYSLFELVGLASPEAQTLAQNIVDDERVERKVNSALAELVEILERE